MPSALSHGQSRSHSDAWGTCERDERTCTVDGLEHSPHELEDKHSTNHATFTHKGRRQFTWLLIMHSKDKLL
jgi:hypothetical protein